MNDKTFASVTAGYLGSGSGNTGGDYYHGIRRSFAYVEHRLSRRSAGPAARRELHGQQLQQLHGG